MPTQSEIVEQMRQALVLSEPELDTSIGTPTRKLLDAVAESVAEAYSDNYMVEYVYDIDTKISNDLDDFVALFGFVRFPAKRASGVVTFVKRAAARFDIFIPSSSQVATSGARPTSFVTTTPAEISTGQSQVTVPVQAAVPGIIGNVASAEVNRRISSLAGIDNVSNPSPLTGGTDSESDDQLRTRFKKTVFRHLAGTQDMYLGVALEDPDVLRAVVVGSSLRFTEQIQLAGSPPAATSTLSGSKHVYPDQVFFGTSLDGDTLFTEGIHYNFNEAANPPTITSIDTTNVPAGIYELSYSYTPQSSRNDPAAGVLRKVDLYIDGRRSREASETRFWRNDKIFSASVGSPYHTGKFMRTATGAAPTVGSYLIPLGFTPVLEVPDTIVINAVTYVENTDYWVVRNTTTLGGSYRSIEGLEWRVAGAPPNDTAFTLSYFYNDCPGSIETALRQWRLVTEDAMVHESLLDYLVVNLVAILSPGFTAVTIDSELFAAINEIISSVGFDGWIQVSDILAAAHGVTGIDSVRFATSADNASNNCVQSVQKIWNPLTPTTRILATYSDGGSPARPRDVRYEANRIPTLTDVILSVRAANTFGAS